MALLLGSFASPTPAVSQHPTGFLSEWEAVSRELRDTLSVSGMVGASWAFFSDGELVAHETFGLADLETGRPVEESTIYHWGSITKTLTGIAVMQLRDRGLLKLDDPVVEYVPELRAAHNPFGSMAEVTLRHLLSHSAGFRGATWPWGGREGWHPHEPTEWSQLVAMLPYTEILFPPGSRYSYSNPGIVFLGQVVERLSGEEWEVYVEKNILRPLGMHRSYFDYTPYHLLAERSNNYTVREGVPEANGLDFDTGITVSNGGLNAPLEDMARYLAFLAGTRDPPDQEHQSPILSRESLHEMWEAVVPVGTSDHLTEEMGLCFFLETFRGHRFVGHTGTQKSFYSFFYIDPERGTGALAAFNTAGTAAGEAPPRPDTGEIRTRFRETLFRRIFPLFQERP
jgi:CubicO group peptidase (beta-lactamase class C family)